MTLDDLPLVERQLCFCGREVRIAAVADQDRLLRAAGDRDMLPFGLLLWESAIALAEVVATLPLAGRPVLELGAGVGLAGLVAAQAGAHVTAIDIDPLALDLSRANAALNGQQHTHATVLADWHRWQPPQRYDVILGADIVYDPDDHAAVARVLAESLAPAGSVLLADPTRPHTAAFLARLTDAGWHCREEARAIADLTFPDRAVSVRMITAMRDAAQLRSTALS